MWSRLGASPTPAVPPLSAASLAPWHHVMDLNRSINKPNPSINTESSNTFKLIEARDKISSRKQGKIKVIRKPAKSHKTHNFLLKCSSLEPGCVRPTTLQGEGTNGLQKIRLFTISFIITPIILGYSFLLCSRFMENSERKCSTVSSPSLSLPCPILFEEIGKGQFPQIFLGA